jgi:hypothetical protein
VIPQWKGAFQHYAYRYAAANYWRVRHVVDSPEDAAQECAVQFCKLCQLFGDSGVDNVRWFMALYKKMLAQAFTNMARSNRRHAMALDIVKHRGWATGGWDGRAEPNHIPAKLVRASPELKTVLHAIDVAPYDLLDLFLPLPQLRFSAEMERAISRSWCRLARVGRVREDLVTELRGLLG